MKNKVLVMIAIIEAIILVLVSGYRIYEYFYMNKSDDVNIPNNEVIENKKDEIIVDLPSFEEDFYKAEYVYSWFYGFNSIKITSKEKIDNYYRVKVDGLNSKSDLEKLLNTIFSENIVNELLNKKIEDDYLFKDIDGALYVYGGYVSEYSYNEINRTISKEEISSDKTIYNVSITSENGINNCNTTYTYNYEKNSDGKLVFTNFEVPVSVCYNLNDKENTDNNEDDNELGNIEELDINSDLVKNLVSPFDYDSFFVTYAENNFIKEDFNVETSSNKQLLAITFNYFFSDTSINKNNLIKEDDKSYYIVSYIDLKTHFNKIFGPDIEFVSENIGVNQIGVCNAYNCDNSNEHFINYSSFDYENSNTKIIYDNINDSFNCPVLMGDCVGSPYYCTSLNNVIKAKAETINDEIYVYYYVYELIENPNTNSCSIYNIHNKENVSEIKNTKCKDNNVVLDNIESETDSLKNESKLPIYKVTYKKQSDGKYYFTKGEWQ